jgi:hypothetical protein
MRNRYWIAAGRTAANDTYCSFQDATGWGVFLVLWLLIDFYVVWWKHGSHELRVALKAFLATIPAIVLAWVVLWVWHMARYPAKRHADEVTLRGGLEAENLRLRGEVARKRHNLGPSEPAFENASAVWAAFSKWREDVGEPTPLLLTTWPDPPSRFVLTFLSYAVKGCRIGNGNLHNLGIKPEDIEDMENQLPRDAVVLHASSDAKGAMALFDSLSSKVLYLKRSYKMPRAPKPYSPNTIWLHFGAGSRWTSEYLDEQAAKR